MEKLNKFCHMKEAGRELAVNLMQDTISDARSLEELNFKIGVLQNASIHILATKIFNEVRRSNVPFHASADMVRLHLLNEYEFLKSIPEVDLTEGKKH